MTMTDENRKNQLIRKKKEQQKPQKKTVLQLVLKF